jgi:8-hydroxy-5-deazaflavin:NADPH oxidoreductase
MNKKIGIIGSGVVAQTLGAGFLKYGYQVMLGTRDVSKLIEWQSGDGKGAKVGSFTETASFGDIVVLAAKGTAALEVLELAGLENLQGKTILDTTNPIADAPPVNGVLQYFTETNESLMEQLQAAIPKANFVKAFNSVGSPFFVNPSFKTKPTMFICGNNKESKKEVTDILDLFGWETADFGMVESARAIEPLCMLWCIPGIANNQWNHAFKLNKI